MRISDTNQPRLERAVVAVWIRQSAVWKAQMPRGVHQPRSRSGQASRRCSRPAGHGCGKPRGPALAEAMGRVERDIALAVDQSR